jgi:hypothetical protein
VSSDNWGGYAVTPHSGRFRRVTGSWTVPSGSCTQGTPSYSAAWVGLGGFDQSSQALEQTGTELDCSRSGRASYSAWYELVPSTAKTLRMTVRPGDKITASVEVRGTNVSLKLRNRNRGTSFSTTKRMSSPDTSSAEWIVEAPSACDSSGNCAVLPLSNFGRVAFSSAAATTTGGRTGGISNGAWSTFKLNLSQAADRGRAGFASASTTGGATPSSLSSGGSAFSIAYQQQQGQASSAGAPTTFPGSARPGA